MADLGTAVFTSPKIPLVVEFEMSPAQGSLIATGVVLSKGSGEAPPSPTFGLMWPRRMG